MTGFPGDCERCGGPQLWTADSEGMIWVKCENPGCLDNQLVLDGFEDEPQGCYLESPPVEPEGRIQVVPLEGSEARMIEEENRDLPF